MSDEIQWADVSISEWLQMIRAEYLEMPGLHLTQPQAQRLWGLDALTSETLLETLVSTGFLRRTRGGGYMLADTGRAA
jgi:hypothetical protein